MEKNRVSAKPFDIVKAIGLAFGDVEAAIHWTGLPVLRVRGCFMAGLAAHPSAEPATLVVRCDLDQRERLLEDAPDTYYITDFYQKYPLVLARLAHLNRDAIHDLLAVSRQMALTKAHRSRRPKRSL